MSGPFCRDRPSGCFAQKGPATFSYAADRRILVLTARTIEVVAADKTICSKESMVPRVAGFRVLSAIFGLRQQLPAGRIGGPRSATLLHTGL